MPHQSPHIPRRIDPTCVFAAVPTADFKKRPVLHYRGNNLTLLQAYRQACNAGQIARDFLAEQVRDDFTTSACDLIPTKIRERAVKAGLDNAMRLCLSHYYDCVSAIPRREGPKDIYLNMIPRFMAAQFLLHAGYIYLRTDSQRADGHLHDYLHSLLEPADAKRAPLIDDVSLGRLWAHAPRDRDGMQRVLDTVTTAWETGAKAVMNVRIEELVQVTARPRKPRRTHRPYTRRMVPEHRPSQ